MVVCHDTSPKATFLPRLQLVAAVLCRQVNRLFNNSVELTASPFVSLIQFPWIMINCKPCDQVCIAVWSHWVHSVIPARGAKTTVYHKLTLRF